ncbi:MAG: hypothetical protein AB1568_17060 [Thermodesulfobacteriota bacterium]
MKRKLLVIGTVLCCLSVGAIAFASMTCKVESASGDQAVLKCDAKDAAELKVGDKVKVKKKTEGC